MPGRRASSRSVLLAQPVTNVVIGGFVVLNPALRRQPDGLEGGKIVITDIMLGLERIDGFRVTGVDALKRLQAGKFIVVLEDIPPSFAGDDIGKAFHVLLVAFFQHHVGGVLVAEKGVEPGRIEAGQEHAHHHQQFDLARLHPLGQITLVVLETLAVDTEAGLEVSVVIGNGRVQEFLGAAVHGRHIRAFVANVADGILFFVGRE